MATNLKAVLFDLDDTLFDHTYSSRCGLMAVCEQYHCFRQVSIEQIWPYYLQLIEILHPQVLQGRLTMEEARLERFRRLFKKFGGEISLPTSKAVSEHYRLAYKAARRVVPGTIPLLKALKPAFKIGIVTNCETAEQHSKLQACQLTPFIDNLITSQDVGIPKPDPQIFAAALMRLDCQAGETVMIGDSWERDIIGADNAGIRAIWFNRQGITCPNPGLAAQVRSFEPVERVLQLIISE